MSKLDDLTERANPRTAELDRLPIFEALRRMNWEDQSVASAVERALPAIEEAVKGIVARLRRGGRLFYVGAGTSGRLGVLDAVECIPTFSTPPEMVQAVIAGGAEALTKSIEGAEDEPAGSHDELKRRGLSGKDALVGIAASGRTPYTVGAVKYARERGALGIGIACNDPSPLLEASDIAIAALVGPEVIAGSTRLKAGTAQKLILNMLSTMTMIRLGKVFDNRMIDVQVTNEKLARRALMLTMEILEIDSATASQLLVDARQNVKTAIVMARRSVGYEKAQELLENSDGFLWRALQGHWQY